MSFSKKILLALTLGIATGLFFGELVGGLKFIGDIYIGLLQMTVLPYIVVALIGNIAKLSIENGKRLAWTGAKVMIALWAIGLAAVPVFALTFPKFESGSFFSIGLVERPEPIDYIALYVPSNPFRALAENLVPAVVVFSILAGVAAIGLPRKDQLISAFDFVQALLLRMKSLAVSLTPYGIFAISASSAGTLSAKEFGLLQGYLVTHTAAVLVLSFWVLPALVSTLTPLRMRDVLRASWPPIVTAFVTGSTFVVLPMIVDGAKELLDEKGLEPDEGTPDVVVPLGYPFPSLGKILTLLFIPFAAWFFGTPLAAADYPTLLGSGFLSSFGSVVVMVPSLLDTFRIPSDIFQLFVLSGVYAGRVSDAANVMHLFVFTLITSAAMAGAVRLRWSGFALRFGSGMGLVLLAVIGGRSLLGWTFDEEYGQAHLVESMQILEGRVEAVEVEPGPNPEPLREGESRLERIRRRGVLRVGYLEDHVPFSYRNRKGELVGFDVAMAHRLARDLGVTLEFSPSDVARMADQLDRDFFDVVMSGVEGSLKRAETMLVADPGFDLNAAFVCRDYRRAEFRTVAGIQRRTDLRVAALEYSLFAEALPEGLPNATIVPIGHQRDFFEGKVEADLLVTSAEAGSAWSVLRPGFAVLAPEDLRVSVPVVYPVGGRDREFRGFLEGWAKLMHRTRRTDEIYDYWILGKGVERRGPRWSVVRDVLRWVE
ncbi:MAG: cation:dicarboxylate symporter family transporter [Planctomycetota bacterium]